MTIARKSRFSTADYLGAAGDLAKLLWKHRGDLEAVNDELEAEKEWARFRARHGDKDRDAS